MGRLDRGLAGAAQAMRKMIADQAAKVQFDELPGQLAFPAVGRLVGPDIAAEAAARAQRAEVAEAHRQQPAGQLAVARVELDAGGRRRQLAVAGDPQPGGLGRVGADEPEPQRSGSSGRMGSPTIRQRRSAFASHRPRAG